MRKGIPQGTAKLETTRLEKAQVQNLKLTGYSTQGRFKNFVIQPIVAILYTNLHVKESCIGMPMVNTTWLGMEGATKVQYMRLCFEQTQPVFRGAECQAWCQDSWFEYWGPG